jgi:hypothetical protein
MLAAAPHKALAIVNTATPRSRNGLRPYRSESLPTIGTTTVAVNMYAVVTAA